MRVSRMNAWHVLLQLLPFRFEVRCSSFPFSVVFYFVVLVSFGNISQTFTKYCKATFRTTSSEATLCQVDNVIVWIAKRGSKVPYTGSRGKKLEVKAGLARRPICTLSCRNNQRALETVGPYISRSCTYWLNERFKIVQIHIRWQYAQN